LCESEEPITVRMEAIRGLAELCKGAANYVAGVAPVLAQLLLSGWACLSVT
jgi:hypothetical protein